MNDPPDEITQLDSKARGSGSSETSLHFLDESGTEHRAIITSSTFTLGRGNHNDLPLNQGNVSRKQALIQFRNGEYILKDRKSKHGTYLNGARIHEVVLHPGDHIQLGGPRGQVVTFRQKNLLHSLIGTGSLPSDSLSVRDFREMGLLMATILKLNSISVLDDLMNLVVDTAIEITRAERGFIIIKDKERQLSFRCARDAQKHTLDSSYIEASRRVPEEVIKTGTRKIIANLYDVPDRAAHSSTQRIGIRSIACVPLRYKPFQETVSSPDAGFVDTIGVLYVDSQSIGNLRTEAQIEALETLATEAASAIYNARLYRELQEKQKLEQELEFARGIQQALLPPPNKILPYVSACSLSLPCHQIGGDFYDYYDFEDGRLGFTVGDVSGKGVPAALMAARLQGIFSAQSLQDLPLPAVIARVNTNLTERLIERTFITLFFGILDSEGNCTCTNAGHNPPMLVRRDGSLSEITVGGMVLGIFPGNEYESETVTLFPGDHLVLFTDGVLEAENSSGEQFGKERFQSLLTECACSPAAEILARLTQGLSSFSSDAPQHDDITLMVLGFRE